MRNLIMGFLFILSLTTAAEDFQKKSSAIPADIDVCEKDTDCVIVPHQHCCGTTKKAINSKYLGDYKKNPSWHKTEDGSCAVIGQCLPNDDVKESHCAKLSNGKHCTEGPRPKK